MVRLIILHRYKCEVVGHVSARHEERQPDCSEVLRVFELHYLMER